VNAIIAKLAQGGTPGQTDTNISGINAKTMVKDVNLNAYYYQKVIDHNVTAAGKTDELGLAGIRAGYAIPQVKNLNVAAEYDQNMGKSVDHVATTPKNNKYSGYAYKVNADYSMDLKGKLGFNAEYAYMSGDKKDDSKYQTFTAINGDYRPGIIVGGGYETGLAAGAWDGKTNLNVGANWTPEKLNKLNIAAKFYEFGVTNKNTYSKKNLGNELDGVLTWTHSASVSVTGYYAMFMPNKDNLGAGAKHDAETMMGAAFNVKF
jgi:hypothetical protein